MPRNRTWLLPVACAATTILGVALTPLAPSVRASASSPHGDAHSTGRRYQSIEVFPPAISLETRRDRQRLIVLAADPAGVQHEVTDQADIDGGALTSVEPGGVLRPIADGAGFVRVAIAGAVIDVPITVTGSGVERPISFRLDVMPVFMAAGCNSGGCHGSARGQDGFRLSLFGFDPEGDYHRITRELAGRRLNLARPEESLLLEKALGRVPHTGEKRLDRDSSLYESLVRWIGAQAPRDPVDIPSVTSIEIFPPGLVLAADGATCRVTVRAKYSDGTDRDVTELSLFRTNNETCADVSRSGVITTGLRGEAFITASFDTHTVGAPVVVLPPGSADDPGTVDMPAANWIDEAINAKLRTLRLTPSPRCDDATFIRRVTLDLIGLLPTPEESAAFIDDDAPDKRARLIDRLLERREFVDQWVMHWAELLQIRSNNEISYKAALRYFEWLRANFSNDVPLDEMVRRILTATGGTFTEPATNFYQNQPDTLVLAENVAQSFLGIRIQCAQCHNHPFDRWTQNDYYGFVSFFSQIGRKRGEDYRETIVFNSRRGEVNHPVTSTPVPPTFLGGGPADVRNRDRREVIAEWITAPGNPWFARSIANRVWAHFMGIGVVEPVDDFRISNPPSNEPLLNGLARRLVEARYDLKTLVRDICNSEAYQRSTLVNASNAGDDRNFSRALIRRMRAETLLDALCQVTEQPEKLRGLPLGARAVEIADGSTTNYFLTTFGRATRESVCSCEVVREPSLSQALHLLNGETVHAKIMQGNVAGRMLQSGLTPEQALDALTRRCFSRPPTEIEQKALATLLAEENADPKQALEDLFWAMLNSKEFLFNH